MIEQPNIKGVFAFAALLVFLVLTPIAIAKLIEAVCPVCAPLDWSKEQVAISSDR